MTDGLDVIVWESRLLYLASLGSAGQMCDAGDPDTSSGLRIHLCHVTVGFT